MIRSELIHNLLFFLRQHAEILYRNNPYTEPVISLLSSDLRKHSSEFHRIRLTEKHKSGGPPEIFWIKIVKNKPIDKINESLDRQYRIMNELWILFHNRSGINQKTYLQCCEPIAFLPEFGALITRECSGALFNTYLLTHTPFFSGNRILSYCRSIGEWLRIFHDYYRESDMNDTDMNDFCKQYKDRFQTAPHPKLMHITLCHHDLTPRNIFVSDNCLQVIDFVGAKKGFPQEDMAFFSNYIMKAKFNLTYPKYFKKRMFRSFLEGYGGCDELLITK